MFKDLFSSRDRAIHRFTKQPNHENLNHLIKYLTEHDFPLPFDVKEFNETLFGLNDWVIAEEVKESFFSQVEHRLFDLNNRANSQEWAIWLRSIRLNKRQLNLPHQDFVDACYSAIRSGNLQTIVSEDIEYLLSCFSPPFRAALGTIDNRDPLTQLRLLLDLFRACIRAIEASGTSSDLMVISDLMRFLEEHYCQLPLEDEAVRSAIFRVKFWEIESEQASHLVEAVESYLLDHSFRSSSHEWNTWIRACRHLNRPINVLSPSTSRSLRDAQHAGKLDDLPRAEYDYLLQCYLRSYGNVLEELETGDQAALPLLLEFASITQMIGPNEFSKRIMERWTRDLPARPRALTTMRNEQAFLAPLVGVGSPHRVSITQYHSDSSQVPDRIVCVGVTGDPTLNAHIFTSLFAAALSCDTEPTFISTVGAMLSLDTSNKKEPQDETQGQIPRHVLHAVISPTGPAEPTKGTPLAGMDAYEALSLVRDLFARFEESTGLVQIKKWQLHDANRLDTNIREAFLQSNKGRLVIKSDQNRTEGTGLVHITPLLCWNDRHELAPLTIELPYHILGAESMFNLVRSARAAHMGQLIAACRHRLALAQQTYQQQSVAVAYWISLTPEEKRQAIENQPKVQIDQQIDLELGIVHQLEEPEIQSKEFYESHTRPGLRDSAKLYAEKYDKLAHKLNDLNHEGGHADILTFKLLIDSAIRRATLPLGQAEIQEEYDSWISDSTDMIWKGIESWAETRGFNPEILAADNILFNARLDSERSVVQIEVWAMLDMHDFIIYIDPTQGIMEVYPGGKTLTLSEAIIHDPEHNIVTPADLMTTFYSWLNNRLNLEAIRSEEQDVFRSKIMGDPKLGTLLQLQVVKQLLFRNKVDEAISIIEKIRKQDVAVVYLWGAIAHEVKYLADKNTEFNLELEGLSKENRAERLINIAVHALKQELTPEESSTTPGFSLVENESGGLSVSYRRNSLPLSDEAWQYLGQMVDKDQGLADGLLQSKHLHLLERESTRLSADDEARLRAGIAALSSIELLKLAEHMKDVAKELPFMGMWTSELRQYIDEIIAHTNGLHIHQPSVTNEINQLRSMTLF